MTKQQKWTQQSAEYISAVAYKGRKPKGRNVLVGLAMKAGAHARKPPPLNAWLHSVEEYRTLLKLTEALARRVERAEDKLAKVGKALKDAT
jgi:hypothetical protein